MDLSKAGFHKQFKTMANLTGNSCGDLQPAVWLSREDGAIQRTPEHSWTSDKPQKQVTAKAAWATSALTPA